MYNCLNIFHKMINIKNNDESCILHLIIMMFDD